MSHPSLQSFSSIQAARILGVNVSSIKRWTDSGLLECKRTAGGHRKFLAKHLLQFIEKNGSNTSIQPLFPLDDANDISLAEHIYEKDNSYLQEQLLRHAQVGDISSALSLLSRIISAATPLYELYDDIVTPVFHCIGNLWAEEKLNTIEEHVTTHAIHQALLRLQALIPMPTETSSAALCLTFSTEEHDIAVQMVGHILEKRGFRVLFAGSKTPSAGLKNYFKRGLIERLYLSSTLVIDPVSAAWELERICDYGLNYGVKIFIGGQGVKQLHGYVPENAVQLENFRGVFMS